MNALSKNYKRMKFLTELHPTITSREMHFFL
jgi:hypothetical protein